MQSFPYGILAETHVNTKSYNDALQTMTNIGCFIVNISNYSSHSYREKLLIEANSNTIAINKRQKKKLLNLIDMLFFCFCFCFYFVLNF